MSLAGDQRDIIVTINHGLDEYGIEFMQQIEKRIDEALAGMGFSRSTTSNWEIVTMVLRYCAQ
jgi:hypothetical protein